MLKTLLRKQLLEMFQSFFMDRKTGKARGKKGTVGYLVLMAAVVLMVCLSFFTMASEVGEVILGHGSDWLYFALLALLSMALGVFGSVFNTYAALYLPKDNEFLQSLPIPAHTLLLARSTGVYVSSLLYAAWIWIPGTAAYWKLTGPDALQIILPLVLLFVLALFVSVLTCLLGWVVAAVSVKAKGKSLITVLMTLILLGGYYFVYFKITESLNEIAVHLGTLSAVMKTWGGYLMLVGKAACGELWPLFLCVGITAALAAIGLWVLSRTWSKLTFTGGSSVSKRSAVPKDYRARSLRKALLLREFKHFGSSPTWMLNGGLGLILEPAAAIALAVKGEALRNALTLVNAETPAVSAALPMILLGVSCLLTSINTITPDSVSLEGKNLWIVNSLPVDPWELLLAKARMGITIGIVPTIFFVLLAGAVLGLDALCLFLTAAASILYLVLASEFGLVLDLKHPNLTWTNMVTVVKQGMPVTVYLFGGWLFGAVTAGLGFLLCQFIPAAVVLVFFLVLFAVLAWLLRRWLKGKGAKILGSL